MVVIRMQRMGSKKRPFYRIVVQDKRKRKEGRAIDFVGRYNPTAKPKLIELDRDKIAGWVQKGAQLSETVQRLLKNTSGGEA